MTAAPEPAAVPPLAAAGGRGPSTPSTAPAPISRRQQAILDAIRAHVAARGYPPSVRELGAAVGLNSTSSVVRQLEILAARGYLRRDERLPRALALLDPDGAL